MSDTTETSNVFAVTVAAISHGDLADQASEMLTELVRRVHETGSKGKLVLTLEVKPRGRDGGQVEVSGKCQPSFPIIEPAPSMFFATEEGALLRDNPNQGSFKFGDEPKKVANSTNQ